MRLGGKIAIVTGAGSGQGRAPSAAACWRPPGPLDYAQPSHGRSPAPDPASDARRRGRDAHPDRKSTRLNSSHGYISYAVFCLKKKKKNTRTVQRRRDVMDQLVRPISI